MKRRIIDIALSLVLCAVLAGCFTIGGAGKVRPQLPEAPARLVDPAFCGTGAAIAGEDARVSARRKELARKCERNRTRSWSGFYEDLRVNLGGRK